MFRIYSDYTAERLNWYAIVCCVIINSTKPNPTQPAGRPNPWTTLNRTRSGNHHVWNRHVICQRSSFSVFLRIRLRFHVISGSTPEQRSAVTDQRECTVAGRQSADQLVPAAASQFAGHRRLLSRGVPDARAVGAAGREGGGQRTAELPLDDGVAKCHLPVPSVQC